MAEPLIQLRQIRKVYRSGKREFLAVSDVSMDIHAGDMLSLVGPSGCGKTTVLKILADLFTPDDGSVRVGSAASRFDPGRDVGMVFQQALLLKWRTVLAAVLNRNESESHSEVATACDCGGREAVPG
jgi:NitT/TauT family transport system ATP-binding protein